MSHCVETIPVKWWDTGGQSPLVICVTLFHHSCQCECLHKSRKCYRHALASGKSYSMLIANILWAIRALSSAGCQDDTI